MTNHNKYSPRSIPSISREGETPTSDTYWHDAFISNLQKSSYNSSIYDEINAILGNSKPKFSSVEEAVRDLKERTGLDKMLSMKQIVASIQEPAAFETIPEMKIFIDNFVNDRPGTSVEAVVYDLLKNNNIRNKMPDASDVDEDVKIYISDKIAEVKARTPDVNKIDMNMGKVDRFMEDIPVDPLAGCEPAT